MLGIKMFKIQSQDWFGNKTYKLNLCESKYG